MADYCESSASSGTKFATFGVPQPVASFQPGPAANPMVLPASVLLPTVISWNAAEYRNGTSPISYNEARRFDRQ
jgi:hypothetical protein